MNLKEIMNGRALDLALFAREESKDIPILQAFFEGIGFYDKKNKVSVLKVLRDLAERFPARVPDILRLLQRDRLALIYPGLVFCGDGQPRLKWLDEAHYNALLDPLPPFNKECEVPFRASGTREEVLRAIGLLEKGKGDSNPSEEELRGIIFEQQESRIPLHSRFFQVWNLDPSSERSYRFDPTPHSPQTYKNLADIRNSDAVTIVPPTVGMTYQFVRPGTVCIKDPKQNLTTWAWFADLKPF